MRSRIGTSASWRFTAITATPRRRSIVHGMPSPTEPASGRASIAVRSSRSSVWMSSSWLNPMLGAVAVGHIAIASTAPTSIFVPPRSTPISVRPSPERTRPFPGVALVMYSMADGRPEAAVLPAHAAEDQGQPPDYKVYKSRPGLFSRLRAPDPGACRDRAKGRGARTPVATARKPPRTRPGPASVAPGAQWMGIVGPRVDCGQLPRVRDLLPDPEGEARRTWATPSTATRSSRQARRRSS